MNRKSLIFAIMLMASFGNVSAQTDGHTVCPEPSEPYSMSPAVTASTSNNANCRSAKHNDNGDDNINSKRLNEKNITIMITPEEFLNDYREAFGEAALLPVAFYYSNSCLADTPKVAGCMFKVIGDAFNGQSVSLSADNLACGGGKFYAGFTEMPERVPGFVSLKEKYKQTPEMVVDCVKTLDQQLTDKKYLNFVRIDKIESLEYVKNEDGSTDRIEGVLIYATPDMLSGLCTWAFYDNNAEDAVSAQFGSGCASVISLAVRENRLGGKRTFIGLFDPSVRPHVDANILSFVIPQSRLQSMLATMRDSCLFGTHAWEKVKARINGNI